MNSVKRASIPSIHLDTNACSGVRQDGGRRRRMVRCPSRTSSRDVNESSMNSGIPFFLWGPVSALPRSLFCRNVRTRCSRDEISVSMIHIESQIFAPSLYFQPYFSKDLSSSKTDQGTERVSCCSY